MLVLESPKRNSPKRKSNGKQQQPAVTKPPLAADEVRVHHGFVTYCSGDGHLTNWEENFVNSLKIKLQRPAVWLSRKEQTKIQELKKKLHYDRPDLPLLPIDPDGIEENNDPDGWPD